MAADWTAAQLASLAAAEELEIAVRRPDQTLRRWTPIWVAQAVDGAYVRTWHRRDTGWFGQVLRSQRARIRVPGLEVDVAVDDVGAGPAGLQAAIDAAYASKYGHYGEPTVGKMVTADAVAATLRLRPID